MQSFVNFLMVNCGLFSEGKIYVIGLIDEIQNFENVNH